MQGKKMSVPLVERIWMDDHWWAVTSQSVPSAEWLHLLDLRRKPTTQICLSDKTWSWASSLDVSSSLEITKKQQWKVKICSSVTHLKNSSFVCFSLAFAKLSSDHNCHLSKLETEILKDSFGEDRVEIGRVKCALTSLAFVGIFRASSVQFVASERFPSSLWHYESSNRMISV